MDKSPGRLDYEADIRRRPNYHDGMPRKTWDQLGPVEQWSWNRAPLPTTKGTDKCRD